MRRLSKDRHSTVGSRMRNMVWDTVRNRLWNTVRNMVINRMRNRVRGSIVRERVRVEGVRVREGEGYRSCDEG